MKNKTKNIKILNLLETKSLMLYASFFHVICKISNIDIWTAKHLVQASFTELTLTFEQILFKVVHKGRR